MIEQTACYIGFYTEPEQKLTVTNNQNLRAKLGFGVDLIIFTKNESWEDPFRIRAKDLGLIFTKNEEQGRLSEIKKTRQIMDPFMIYWKEK